MMKRFKVLLIAAMVTMGVQYASAQAKVAHVDVMEIMQKMPARIEAEKQLAKLGETYDSGYKTLVDEYQAKIKKYDAEATTVSEQVNEERTKEVQEMQKRIVDYRDNAQKELQKKEADLLKPIMDKVKTSIEKVGKAKGYQYILNASDLLLADGPNITADVKKDLGF